MALTRNDVLDDAKRLGCSPAHVLAVAEVESRGAGFNTDGTVKTLFEGHWFHRYTRGQYDTSDPDLSYPVWTKKFYGKTFKEEYARFMRALQLDPVAALLSTSFGAFQVMGFNYAICGYPTVNAFYRAMCQDENSQLEAFVGYVLHNGLADELRDQKWDAFALRYNGAEYKKNDYAGKLARAYQKYLKLEPK